MHGATGQRSGMGGLKAGVVEEDNLTDHSGHHAATSKSAGRRQQCWKKLPDGGSEKEFVGEEATRIWSIRIE